MAYSVALAEDFKIAALMLLEDGTTADEVKSLVDDAVAEMEQARADAGETA